MRVNCLRFLACLILGVLPSLCAFSQEKKAADSPPAVLASEGDVVFLPIENGGVDSNLLFQTVADDLHWIAGSVAGFSRALGTNGQGGQLSGEQLDTLVKNFPTVFSYRNLPETQTPGLAVDTGELASLLAEKKSNLRLWLSGIQQEALSDLTKVADTWTDQDQSPPRIVVVSAGLHSPSESAQAMAVELHKRTNLPMCVFKYPNDGPIAESSHWLAMELMELHQQYPQSKITLITHSMGGLVARGAIEMPSASDGESRSSLATRVGIDQLIQVCPPNHGSSLSEFGPLLEGFEQLYNLTNRREGKRPRVLLKMITDGFNEATTDLNPKSDFLKELNSCSRDKAVRYTILAGNEAPIKPGVTGLLGNIWDRIAAAVDEPEIVDRRVRDVLDCPELQNGKGDGVVTVDSARLEGVDDFQILKMHHLTWAQLDSEEAQPLLDNITARLGISL